MTHSENIAALIGPMLAATGLSMLINRAEMSLLANQLADDYGLIFVSGILLLVAGVAVVRVHHHWPRDWRSIITALGWISIVSGLARILFFRQLAHIAPSVAQWSAVLPLAGIVLLAVGAFLTLKAFR